MNSVLRFLRRRAEQDREPVGQPCVRCRKVVPGGTGEELFFAGGVLLPGVGWFCSQGCEHQYRVAFRIEPGRITPPARPRATSVVEQVTVPERPPATDLLTSLLKSKGTGSSKR